MTARKGPKTAKAAKTSKAKAPTLEELIAKERECRELLKCSLRNISDEVGEELPSVIGCDPGDFHYVADEVALHGRGIDYDASEWGKAAEALAEAMAKVGKEA